MTDYFGTRQIIFGNIMNATVDQLNFAAIKFRGLPIPLCVGDIILILRIWQNFEIREIIWHAKFS